MNERRNKIEERYFAWMLSKIDPSGRRFAKYSRLLEILDSRDFKYTIPMDGNRFEDGVDLRYRFGQECEIDKRIISSELDIRPCSVLEMMVALAIRCEEHIMGDDEIGDRTGVWFNEMLKNLNLLDMTDYILENAKYAEKHVNHVLDIFLNREYEPNGSGGLIVLNNCQYDLRTVEIWYQMMWYLNEKYC